jgi:DNA-binding response OmpR family regulator
MGASASETEIRKHILCLDDDEDTCHMMDALLRTYGYEVTTASSVAEAQAAIEREKFDMLIFDGLGLELCEQVRKTDHNTPILFLTGLASQDDIDKAMNAGAQAYLVKPIDMDVLEQTILKFIK